VERYFKRYRKSRRAVPILEERLSLLEGGLERGRQLLESVRAADSLVALEPLEEEAAALCRRRRPAAKPRSAPEGRAGPRRFLSSEGFEILVGRNARGNDDLTLRRGRGNDLFVHLAGSPGAHVVVRAKPGKTVPLETLLDAALLAVYYSLPVRSRGAVAAGTKAEVDYTPLKYVRKPKGLKPGAVLLASHKTLRVQVDLDRLDRLRRSTGEG
jgi:predicted ribosome quality control (RQC) complex YloA/Tae2 family protein